MAPAFEAHQSQGPPPQVGEQVAASQNNLHFSNHESKVTVVGSGNWGSVAAKLIASNTLRLTSFHGIYNI
jgi:glycerol-3-phosphate dehydrogenase (NAD+)